MARGKRLGAIRFELRDLAGVVENIGTAVGHAGYAKTHEDVAGHVDDAIGWAQALVDDLKEIRAKVSVQRTHTRGSRNVA